MEDLKMEYTSIYKNGKPERFFIKADDPKEWAFLQPYFLATNIDKKRHGNILEMNCLFSGSVWQGRQRHGYGYCAAADVYYELITIINKIHKKRLTASDREELRKINTHEEKLALSPQLLENLSRYNDEHFKIKFNIA
jgi:hypothetical protein